MTWDGETGPIAPGWYPYEQLGWVLEDEFATAGDPTPGSQSAHQGVDNRPHVKLYQHTLWLRGQLEAFQTQYGIDIGDIQASIAELEATIADIMANWPITAAYIKSILLETPGSGISNENVESGAQVAESKLNLLLKGVVKPNVTEIWSPRIYPGVESFSNYIWVAGGGSLGAGTVSKQHDVWYSSNGASWAKRTDVTGWTGRLGNSLIQHIDPSDATLKLWMVGGETGAGYSDEIWKSLDGIIWNKVELEGPTKWTARSRHCVISHAGLLVVIGGVLTGEIYSGEVWVSSDGGKNWTQLVDFPASARAGHKMCVFNGNLWVMGGDDGVNYFNDIRWTADGNTWQSVTPVGDTWEGRSDFGLVVREDPSDSVIKMWVLGGQGVDGGFSDVWKSSDGVTWTLVTDSALFGKRWAHGAVESLDSSDSTMKFWVLGGSTDTTQYTADVFKSSDGLNWVSVSSTYSQTFASTKELAEYLVALDVRLSEYISSDTKSVVEAVSNLEAVVPSGFPIAYEFPKDVASNYIYVDSSDRDRILCVENGGVVLAVNVSASVVIFKGRFFKVQHNVLAGALGSAPCLLYATENYSAYVPEYFLHKAPNPSYNVSDEILLSEMGRQDTVILEFWKEAIPDQDGYAFPKGNIYYYSNTDAKMVLAPPDPGPALLQYYHTPEKVLYGTPEFLDLVKDPNSNLSLDYLTGSYSQWRFRVRVIEGARELEGCSPIGSGEIEASSYMFRNIPIGSEAETDPGWWVAQNSQGDYHGVNDPNYPTQLTPTYAIPLCALQRKNRGVFDEDYNPNGSARLVPGKTITSMQDCFDPEFVSCIRVGDSITEPYVAEFASCADKGWTDADDSLVKVDGFGTWYRTGYSVSTVSGRPDDLFFDVITEKDLIDQRHTVSYAGWNVEEMLWKNLRLLFMGRLKSEWANLPRYGIDAPHWEEDSGIWGSDLLQIDGLAEENAGPPPAPSSVVIPLQFSDNGTDIFVDGLRKSFSDVTEINNNREEVGTGTWGEHTPVNWDPSLQDNPFQNSYFLAPGQHLVESPPGTWTQTTDTPGPGGICNGRITAHYWYGLPVNSTLRANWNNHFSPTVPKTIVVIKLYIDEHLSGDMYDPDLPSSQRELVKFPSDIDKYSVYWQKNPRLTANLNNWAPAPIYSVYIAPDGRSVTLELDYSASPASWTYPPFDSSNTAEKVFQVNFPLMYTAGSGMKHQTWARALVRDTYCMNLGPYISEGVTSKIHTYNNSAGGAGYLYANTGPKVAGDAEIFTLNPAGTMTNLWTEETIGNIPWVARKGHKVVYFEGNYYLTGGELSNGTRKNDVWISSDGVKWTELLQPLGEDRWTGRKHHSLIVFDGIMYLMGGYDVNNQIKNDVWTSVNGTNWTKVTDSAPWSARYEHTLAVKDTKLFLMGGRTNTGYSDETWYTLDGVNWERTIYGDSPWKARYGHASINFNSKLWVIGGTTTTNQNDIWSSSDGVGWDLVSANGAPGKWSARRDHKVVSFNGNLILIGGVNDSNTVFGDVWSSSDGTTWTLITVDGSAFQARKGHDVVVLNGKLYVIGGKNQADQLLGDIWTSSDGANWTRVYCAAPWDGLDVKSVLLGSTIFAIPERADNKFQVWKYNTVTQNWSLGVEIPDTIFTSAGRKEFVLIPYNNFLWFFGGISADGVTYYNDLWKSSDGITWTLVLPSGSGPSARKSARAVVFSSKLWIIGGTTSDGVFSNEVWNTTNGQTWETIAQHVNVTPWLQNYNSTGAQHITVTWGGLPTLIAPMYKGSDLPAVWQKCYYSRDGENWTAANRSAISKTMCVFKGKMYAFRKRTAAYEDPDLARPGTLSAFNYFAYSVSTGDLLNDDTWDHSYTWIFASLLEGGQMANNPNNPGFEDTPISFVCCSATTMYAVFRGVNGSYSYSTTDGVNWNYHGKLLKYNVTTGGNLWTYDWYPRMGVVATIDGIERLVVLATPFGNINLTWATIFFAGYGTGSAWHEISHISYDSGYLPYITGASILKTSDSRYYVLGQWRASSGSVITHKTYEVISNFSSYIERTANSTWGDEFPTVYGLVGNAFYTFNYGNPYSGYTLLKTVDLNNVPFASIPMLWGLEFGRRSGFTLWAQGTKMYIAGGLTTSYLNDVWSSSDGWTWTRIQTSAAWSARSEAVAVVNGSTVYLFKGRIFSTFFNDAWKSVDSGITWTQLSGSTNWDATTKCNVVPVTISGQLVLHSVGGSSNTLTPYGGYLRREVWTFNTVTQTNWSVWDRVYNNAPWGGRYEHKCVVINGKILLVGGINSSGNSNDVWRTDADASLWTLVGTNYNWSKRGGHSVMAFSGKVVLIGGDDGQLKDDLWYSSDDGVTFEKAFDSISGIPRKYHACTVFNNVMYMLGGRNASTSFNDVWKSTGVLVAWTKTTQDAFWSGRCGHVSFVYNSKLWISGGINGSGYFGDLWYSTDGGVWTKQAVTYNSGGSGDTPYSWAYFKRRNASAFVIGSQLLIVGGTIPTLTSPPDISAHTVNCRAGDPSIWDATSTTFSAFKLAEAGSANHSSVGVIFGGDSVVSAGVHGLSITSAISNTLLDWTLITITGADPWSARSGHQMLTHLNDLWLIGGETDAGYSSEVWYSYNGVTWVKSCTAPFSARRDFGLVEFGEAPGSPNNLMYVLGGYGATGYVNSVYRSNDGVNWSLDVPTPNWVARAGHRVAKFNGKIFLIGGTNGSERNDVYSRNLDPDLGWVEHISNGSAPFSARQRFGLVVFNNKLWIIGGLQGTTKLKDVWYSDLLEDGNTWHQATATAFPTGRYDFACLAVDNKMWVIGGHDGTSSLKEIYTSSDGITWTRATDNAPFGRRSSFDAVVYNQKIYLAGGEYFTVSPAVPTRFKDVWKSTTGSGNTKKLWIDNLVSPFWKGKDLEVWPVVKTKGKSWFFLSAPSVESSPENYHELGASDFAGTGTGAMQLVWDKDHRYLEFQNNHGTAIYSNCSVLFYYMAEESKYIYDVNPNTKTIKRVMEIKVLDSTGLASFTGFGRAIEDTPWYDATTYFTVPYMMFMGFGMRTCSAFPVWVQDLNVTLDSGEANPDYGKRFLTYMGYRSNFRRKFQNYILGKLLWGQGYLFNNMWLCVNNPRINTMTSQSVYGNEFPADTTIEGLTRNITIPEPPRQSGVYSDNPYNIQWTYYYPTGGSVPGYLIASPYNSVVYPPTYITRSVPTLKTGMVARLRYIQLDSSVQSCKPPIPGSDDNFLKVFYLRTPKTAYSAYDAVDGMLPQKSMIISNAGSGGERDNTTWTPYKNYEYRIYRQLTEYINTTRPQYFYSGATPIYAMNAGALSGVTRSYAGAVCLFDSRQFEFDTSMMIFPINSFIRNTSYTTPEVYSGNNLGDPFFTYENNTFRLSKINTDPVSANNRRVINPNIRKENGSIGLGYGPHQEVVGQTAPVPVYDITNKDSLLWMAPNMYPQNGNYMGIILEYNIMKYINGSTGPYYISDASLIRGTYIDTRFKLAGRPIFKNNPM